MFVFLISTCDVLFLVAPVVGFLLRFVENRFLGVAGGLIVGIFITCTSFISEVRLLILFLSIFNGKLLINRDLDSTKKEANTVER